jgi:hypothetical protein
MPQEAEAELVILPTLLFPEEQGDRLVLVEMAARRVLMQHLDKLVPDLAAVAVAGILDLAQLWAAMVLTEL